MEDAQTDAFYKFYEEIKEIEKKINEKNIIETKIKLIEFQLDFFANIDTMNYHEVLLIMNKIRVISIISNLKSFDF